MSFSNITKFISLLMKNRETIEQNSNSHKSFLPSLMNIVSIENISFEKTKQLNRFLLEPSHFHSHRRVHCQIKVFFFEKAETIEQNLIQTSPFHFHRRIHNQLKLLLLSKQKQLNRFLFKNVHLSSNHWLFHRSFWFWLAGREYLSIKILNISQMQ